VHYRAWLEVAFGYNDQIVGSHAGISDTCDALRAAGGHPKDQVKPWGGRVLASPEIPKATAEIAGWASSSVNAGLISRSLKRLPRRGRGGR
jgi:hypothetical protein